MILKKFISGSLALGILLNSMLTSISSFAGILSEDGRYESFEGSNLVIDNILEEDKVDIEIEGNTLVNLCSEMNSNTQWVLKDGWWELSKAGVLFLDFKALVKPNTTYTVILNAKLDNSNGIVFGFRKDDLQWEGIVHSLRLNGINKFKFTTTSNEVNRFTIHRATTVGEETTIGVKDILILEGDWTNKEVPSYFEGMKSVGQDNVNGYRIEIISNNKNLFDGELEHGYIGDSNGTLRPYGSSGKSTLNYIPIKSQIYTLYWDCYSAVSPTCYYYDKDYNYLGRQGKTVYKLTDSYTFNVPYSDAKYMKFRLYSDNNGLIEDSFEGITIQLEEGTQATPYVSHQSNILQIPLSEPLRGLPNGTKDRIIKRNGQWFIERNCGEILLDGTQEIYNKEELNGIYRFMFPVNNVKPHGRSISDKYPTTVGDELYEHLRASDNRIWYYNLPSVEMDKEDVLEKFANNPTRVVYELAEPIYEPLNINLSLPIYEGTTYISNDSAIPANIKVTVDRVLNRAVEYTELAKANPTIANLSRARYWTNLLKESTKKDELQEEINNNTDIVDLQLERKTTSANLDVYIKCENMLSMSLDTNQIIFEDFSGIEDVEKASAINITINSSLPYQLNAYLPTEIQSSDKTNTMDKQILNIKENSETDYKEFSNINEKVVLKDNCPAGNDLTHGVDLKLVGGIAHEKDVYKTTIKFEIEQK